MENPKSRTDVSRALGEVSASLFELRDALVELSLSLRDWQFDHDLEQRKTSETAVHELLDQIRSTRDAS